MTTMADSIAESLCCVARRELWRRKEKILLQILRRISVYWNWIAEGIYKGIVKANNGKGNEEPAELEFFSAGDVWAVNVSTVSFSGRTPAVTGTLLKKNERHGKFEKLKKMDNY